MKLKACSFLFALATIFISCVAVEASGVVSDQHFFQAKNKGGWILIHGLSANYTFEWKIYLSEDGVKFSQLTKRDTEFEMVDLRNSGGSFIARRRLFLEDTGSGVMYVLSYSILHRRRTPDSTHEELLLASDAFESSAKDKGVREYERKTPPRRMMENIRIFEE